MREVLLKDDVLKLISTRQRELDEDSCCYRELWRLYMEVCGMGLRKLSTD